MLLASLIAAGLWDYYRVEFTFYCRVVFAVLVLRLLALIKQVSAEQNIV
ncbi:MAG: hypothetical protein RQ733_04995 [Methyloprofundus sp.]|nr:hypothetical protein [Methyloprofundus sp.]